MSTIVMKMGEGTTTALTSKLAPWQVPSKNPYISFAAKKDGISLSIYTSGKIVFQGNQAEQLAQEFGYQAEDATSTTSSGQNLPLIGTDEVGNGSYFGGLAVVASFVRPKDHTLLRQLGVGDSKTLTDQKILQIAPILEEKIPHRALLLSPSKYNEVVGDGLRHNAVSVKVALHNQAIFLLLSDGVQPEKIVIDAFTSPSNYQKYVRNERNQVTNPLTLEEKAEGKYLAVAVSSIIARKMFLENLDKLGQEIGFTLPSGAGSKSDQVASRILAKHGMPGLAHVAKLHFKNTIKAQNLLK
ncbi:ribonuclease HIII [Streptococcus caprae]|uniref:Ribonuclease HIII n=1 Tax=Streptococcus caprae TaxID=1640501 RepID=A0ABV8CT30_9STRE